MSRYSENAIQSLIEILHEDFKSFRAEVYEDFRSFRSENKEGQKHLESVLETQNRALLEHTQELIKLTQTVYGNGNGNTGVLARLDQIEKNQKEFKEKFLKIETQEKIRSAVLGAICALCSSIGGIITYFISVYISLSK